MNQIDEMMKRVEHDLLGATSGERAIIGMLAIVSHLLGTMGEDQDRMAANVAKLAAQFEAVSGGGRSIRVEKTHDQ